jgi:regulatory protein YycI of two-component signal transduction system YycFG
MDDENDKNKLIKIVKKLIPKPKMYGLFTPVNKTSAELKYLENYDNYYYRLKEFSEPTYEFDLDKYSIDFESQAMYEFEELEKKD